MRWTLLGLYHVRPRGPLDTTKDRTVSHDLAQYDGGCRHFYLIMTGASQTSRN